MQNFAFFADRSRSAKIKTTYNVLLVLCIGIICTVDFIYSTAAFIIVYIPPVMSVSTNFKVSDRRKGIFKVTCTSIGGRVQEMFIRGPFGVVNNLAITPVGVVNGTWNDSYFTENPGEDGRNGDIYTCFASNGVSSSSNDSTFEGYYVWKLFIH